jgi:hypothetical protein
MLRYLVDKAMELEEAEGHPPYIWVAVHAWYEGALNTLANPPESHEQGVPHQAMSAPAGMAYETECVGFPRDWAE